MTKGAIYYTDFNVDPLIMKACQDQLRNNFNGKIVSISLNKPLSFGKNIVLKEKRGYPTMVKQIILGLEALDTDIVFFLEHDVLYSRSHFDFTPPRDDIFYYNENVWRWMFGSDKAIQHDRMIPLSSLCVNREFALAHYKLRLRMIKANGWDKLSSGDQKWVRKIGYEPGTKKRRRGGITDDDFATWKSEFPNIDIRHDKTFSPTKIKLEDFKHKPKWWKEISVDEIIGWKLKKLFNL